MTKVRKATIEDCDTMMQLIHELAHFEKAPEQVTVSIEEFKEAGFGKQSVWEAFVAEQNGQVIGMSLYYIRYSTWKGKRLYLEDLIVNEPFRGTGVGRLLLDKTIAHAKEMKYSGMMWQVLDWNDAAINFYEKYDAEFDSGWLNVNLNFK